MAGHKNNSSGQRLSLYLSASLSNQALNERLRARLPKDQFELVLPQEFAPADVDHPHFPRAIYDQCIREMERCDGALLLLDSFGVDCASEAGWFAGRGKPLIGIVSASCHFLRHWMVKGNLTGLICLDSLIHRVVLEDPILSRIPVRLHPDPETIATAVAEMFQQFRLPVVARPLARAGGKNER